MDTLVRVAVAQEELYFPLIDHMLIRYIFREKSFLSVYLYNLAWWASNYIHAATQPGAGATDEQNSRDAYA